MIQKHSDIIKAPFSMSTRSARQRFFLLFVLLFVITAPLIVLYTAGYRWSPSSGIIKTGTFLLSTTPRDAVVVLDGRRLKDKTPSIVKHVRPGDHTVRLELEGHAPWGKRLRVESGMTTFADTVVLFALAEPTPFLTTPLKAAAAQNGTLVWAQQDNNWTEMWNAGMKRAEPQLMYRAAHADDMRLQFMDDRRIRVLFGDEVRTVNLNGANETHIPDTRLIVTNTPRATVVTLRDRPSEPLVSLPRGDFAVTGAHDAFVVVEDVAAMRLALVNQDDALAPLRLMEDAFKTQWLGRNTLLFADRYAIHLYDAAAHETETLARVSEPIVDVFWHEAHPSYVFYATAREVRAVDMDTRGGRLTHTLATADRVFGFGLDARGQTLAIAATRGIDTGWFLQPLYGQLPKHDETQNAEIEIENGIDDAVEEE